MDEIFKDQMVFNYDLWNGGKSNHYVDISVYCFKSFDKSDKYQVETSDVNGRVNYDDFSGFPSSKYKNCVDKIVQSHKGYRDAVKLLKNLKKNDKL